MDEKKNAMHNVQISIAIIGVIGALGAALLSNWDKVFTPTTTPTPQILIITSTKDLSTIEAESPNSSIPATNPPDSSVTDPSSFIPATKPPGSSDTDPSSIPVPDLKNVLCEKLDGRVIYITQYYLNDPPYYGVIGSKGIQLEKMSNVDFSFSTTVNFGSIDELIYGNCNENTINMTREGYGFTQYLDGYLEQISDGTITITGSYTNKGYNEGTFSWEGIAYP